MFEYLVRVSTDMIDTLTPLNRRQRQHAHIVQHRSLAYTSRSERGKVTLQASR